MINLDKVKMNVIETSANGAVNKDTILEFTQNYNFVYAAYAGGKIKKGFLVGLINGNTLEFNFCHFQTDSILDNSISTSELTISDKGKLRLIEHFEWKSRSGEFGVDIFEEI